MTHSRYEEKWGLAGRVFWVTRLIFYSIFFWGWLFEKCSVDADFHRRRFPSTPIFVDADFSIDADFSSTPIFRRRLFFYVTFFCKFKGFFPQFVFCRRSIFGGQLRIWRVGHLLIRKIAKTINFHFLPRVRFEPGTWRTATGNTNHYSNAAGHNHSKAHWKSITDAYPQKPRKTCRWQDLNPWPRVAKLSALPTTLNRFSYDTNFFFFLTVECVNFFVKFSRAKFFRENFAHEKFREKFARQKFVIFFYRTFFLQNVLASKTFLQNVLASKTFLQNVLQNVLENVL